MGDPRDERLLATFLELVAIDSPTFSERSVAEYCVRAFEDAGCSVWVDGSAATTGSDTGNVIAELPGAVPATLALSAHMDCVMPCLGVEAVVEDGVVRSAGETVLGADDKAGLAAVIECVRRVSEGAEARPTIRAIITVAEEVGLVGAKALAPADVTGDLCLVLDAHGEPGGIVTAAPTHYTFRAAFSGRAAHAGVEPEAGVSALVMASEAICAMRLGRLDEETTANVGTANGGTATNVVPAEVVLTGECRSIDREKVEALREEMERIMREAALAHDGSVDVAWKLEYEGYRYGEDDPIVQQVTRACEAVGLRSHVYTTGGGSDANVLGALGVPTLALGCGMTDVHSTIESITVADLESITRLVTTVAEQMGRQAP